MEVIINGKTLSIRHYLNKKLKPVIDELSSKKHYPLYTQIVYETQNTKFKAFSSTKPNEFSTWHCDESCEDEIREGKTHCLSPEIKQADEQIADIIRYEILTYKKKFKLTGLGNRLHVYWQSVDSLVNSYLFDSVMELLGSKLIYNDYVKIEDNYTVDQLSQVIDEAKKLYPNLLEEIPEPLTFWAHMLIITSVTPQVSCYRWLVKNEKTIFLKMIEEILATHYFPSPSDTSADLALFIDQLIKQETGY